MYRLMTCGTVEEKIYRKQVVFFRYDFTWLSFMLTYILVMPYYVNKLYVFFLILNYGLWRGCGFHPRTAHMTLLGLSFMLTCIFVLPYYINKLYAFLLIFNFGCGGNVGSPPRAVACSYV